MQKKEQHSVLFEIQVNDSARNLKTLADNEMRKCQLLRTTFHFYNQKFARDSNGNGTLFIVDSNQESMASQGDYLYYETRSAAKER